MRHFETKVQELKNAVLRETARLAWEDRLPAGVVDIPEKIIPGPEPSTRCCIYKERAIIGQRVKMALGGDRSNPNLVEVLKVACDECPVTEITVGPACRGCLATRCVHACPKGAISIVNHRSVIDHSKCVLCGKCVEACPYGAIEKHQRPCERGCPVGAISMGEDKKASINVQKCISCGACTYQCPFGAIMDKSFILDAIDLLRAGERYGYTIHAAVAPSIVGQFAPATLGQVVTGLKLLGFHHVDEVAYGADLTAAHEAEELEEKGVLSSSCCPAFVNYVEKNFPEQAGELVSKTPSPMAMLGKHIKAMNHEARVIFIGPCVAKKLEYRLARTARAIDCVLTFEELAALFESRDIDLTTLPEAELDEASGYGRGFAASGGVSAAVAQTLKEKGSEFQVRAVPCSGIEACKLAFLKQKAGKLEGNFIEGMACVGGCIQGPANLIRSPRNKADLDQHVKEAGKETVLAPRVKDGAQAPEEPEAKEPAAAKK